MATSEDVSPKESKELKGIDQVAEEETENNESCNRTDEPDLSSEELEKVSDIATFFNLSNGIMGTGILAMGFVFRCGGLWSFLVVPLVSIFGNYTGKILVELLCEKQSDGNNVRQRNGYLDLGEDFSPAYGRLLVNTINSVENFAHCILILLIGGGIMNELVPGLTDDIWTVICAIPIFSMIFLRRIRLLAWIASTTVILGAVLVLIAAGYSFKFTKEWPKAIESGKKFSLHKVSLAIGITIVTYATHPYLFFLEKSMATKENFSKLMNVSFFGVTVLKMVTGFLVYLAYNERTHPIMTLDFPLGPLHTITSLLLFVIALTFFVFPMFTLFDILEQSWPKRLLEKDKPKRLHILFARLFLICLAVLVAVVTPHFGLGIALVGNLTANLLVFILPCVFHIKKFHSTLTSTQWIADIIIILMAVVWGITGIVFTIKELIDSFQHEDLNPTDPLEYLK